MRLVYCKIDSGNFGDDLNVPLWREIFPNFANDLPDDHALFGIGTILSGKCSAIPHKIVFGSGCRGTLNDLKPDPSWEFAWVRGPLSARRLGLEPGRALTDPAILWQGLSGLACADRRDIGFIPHHRTMSDFAWKRVAAYTGFRLIDPRQPPQAVASEIARCKKLITESLHGAIFADALRVPFLPVVLAHRFNMFKWCDWLASMALKPDIAAVHHCLWDRDVSFLRKAKAVFWKGMAGAGLAPAYCALRPLGISGERELECVSANLETLARTDSVFQLSRPGAVDGLRARMSERCSDAALRLGMTYREVCRSAAAYPLFAAPAAPDHADAPGAACKGHRPSMICASPAAHPL